MYYYVQEDTKLNWYSCEVTVAADTSHLHFFTHTNRIGCNITQHDSHRFWFTLVCLALKLTQSILRFFYFLHRNCYSVGWFWKNVLFWGAQGWGVFVMYVQNFSILFVILVRQFNIEPALPQGLSRFRSELYDTVYKEKGLTLT